MDSSQDRGSDIARMIWIVGSPMVFAVGVPGNLITIIVLLRSNYKRSSTSVFLTFLAVADLLVLTITLPRWWVIYVFGVDIRHVNNAFCKLHWFFTYFNGCFSSACLVAVTIERIISIIRPYKVKTWCTVNTAIITSVSIILILIAFHGHILYGLKLFYVTEHVDGHNRDSKNHGVGDQLPFCNSTLEGSNMTDNTLVERINTTLSVTNSFKPVESTGCLNKTENKTIIDQTDNPSTVVQRRKNTRIVSVCWFDDPMYGTFFLGAYHIMLIFIYNVVTEVSIFVGIVVIIRQLAASKRLRKRMEVNLARGTGVNGKKSVFETYSAQITRSLLLVSVVFFFCSTPVQIFLAGRSVWIDSKSGMTETQELIWVVFNMLYYINHAVNFILYFLSGARFRKQVKETFGCIKKGNQVYGVSLSHVSSQELARKRPNLGFTQSLSSVN